MSDTSIIPNLEVFEEAAVPAKRHQQQGFITGEQLRKAFGLSPAGKLHKDEFPKQEKVVDQTHAGQPICQRTRVEIKPDHSLRVELEIGSAEIAQREDRNYIPALTIKAEAEILREEVTGATTIGYRLKDLEVLGESISREDFSNDVFLRLLSCAAHTETA